MSEVNDQSAAPKKRRKRVDTELEQFRSLMEPPGTFEDGFSWPAFLGAIFVALVMVPGAIYMSLIAGTTIGPAARWVTVILFIEVARRANKTLRRAEIFTLFYLTGAIMAAPSAVAGQYQGGLAVLWNQFFAQSAAAQATGIAEKLPIWYAPTAANTGDPNILEHHTVFQWEWMPAIALGAFAMIMGRLDNMVLGYGLFRLASDVEKLPFPMAPVRAQGVMALSEEQDEEKAYGKGDTDDADAVEEGGKQPDKGSWRWRVFSIGSVMGVAFGFVYLGIPTITGALLGKPITILPIPFRDFTQDAAQIPRFDAVPVALSFDLGIFILGMVLPFWAVTGTFIGLIITFILNPVLYNIPLPNWSWLPESLRGQQMLESWTPSDNMQKTFYKNNIDFYFSFSIGVALSIAIVGFWTVIKGLAKLRRFRKEQHDDSAAAGIPASRGDIRTRFIIIIYLITTTAYIAVSMTLLTLFSGDESGWHWGVFYVMLFYGFLYTPVISYVSARLEGIAGQIINIPFVKEASFILSGYNGVAVWFLPVPLHNYGFQTVAYRESELTGTSFWSIWKSEILLTPIILVGSIVFANFIWSLGPIPSAQYPYAQEWWEVTAEQQTIVFTATMGGYTPFKEAFNPWLIGGGLAIGLAAFAVLGWLGAPVFLIYGVVRGLNQTLPFAVIPEFIGALIGRYYFQKKMGLTWRQYVPVVFAGYSCGMGLIGTFGIGINFLVTSVFQLPF